MIPVVILIFIAVIVFISFGAGRLDKEKEYTRNMSYKSRPPVYVRKKR